MVDRIRELLTVRQLTPTQFADTIGVARPIISHILSGRNEPSLKVVQKIVDTFPEVSLSWLLKGNGSMMGPESGAAATALAPVAAPAKQSGGRKTPEAARPASGGQQASYQPNRTSTVPTAPVSDANRGAAGLEHLQGEAVPSISTPPGPVAGAALEASGGAMGEALGAVVAAAPTLLAASPHSAASPLNATVAGIVAGARTDNSNGPTIPPAAQPFLKADKAIRRIVIFYQDGTFTDYQPENA